jgi:hypothetical protein
MMYNLHVCFIAYALLFIDQSSVSAENMPMENRPPSKEKAMRIGMRVGFLPHLRNSSPYQSAFRNLASTGSEDLAPTSRCQDNSIAAGSAVKSSATFQRREDSNNPVGHTVPSPILVACAQMSVDTSMQSSSNALIRTLHFINLQSPILNARNALDQFSKVRAELSTPGWRPCPK